jgi:hypothetical protein
MSRAKKKNTVFSGVQNAAFGCMKKLSVRSEVGVGILSRCVFGVTVGIFEKKISSVIVIRTPKYHNIGIPFS